MITQVFNGAISTCPCFREGFLTHASQLPCDFELKLLLFFIYRFFDYGGDHFAWDVLFIGACNGALYVLNGMYHVGNCSIDIEKAKVSQRSFVWHIHSIHAMWVWGELHIFVVKLNRLLDILFAHGGKLAFHVHYMAVEVVMVSGEVKVGNIFVVKQILDALFHLLYVLMYV